MKEYRKELYMLEGLERKVILKVTKIFHICQKRPFSSLKENSCIREILDGFGFSRDKKIKLKDAPRCKGSSNIFNT